MKPKGSVTQVRELSDSIRVRTVSAVALLEGVQQQLKERRSQPRFPYAIILDVQIPGWPLSERTTAVDVSHGGLRFPLPYRPALGATVEVRILLPENRRLFVPCTVRHVTEAPAAQALAERQGTPVARLYHVGVSFTSTPAIRDVIIKFTASGSAG